MNYFVTGATGFIGGFFMEQLVARQGQLYVLVREASTGKLDALKARLPASAAQRITPVYGDITAPNMGLSANDLGMLKGNVDHFFHFAAIYDMAADEASQIAGNINGTANVVSNPLGFVFHNQMTATGGVGACSDSCGATLGGALIGNQIAPPTVGSGIPPGANIPTGMAVGGLIDESPEKVSFGGVLGVSPNIPAM